MEHKIKLVKQEVFDITAQLEEEIKQKKSAMTNSRSKDVKINSLQEEIANANKSKEDALKQMKKSQTQAKDLQTMIEDNEAQIKQMTITVNDTESKCKALQEQLVEHQDEILLSKKSCKQAENDKQELEEMVEKISKEKEAIMSEKKMLQQNIADIEGTLDDEQCSLNDFMEKAKRRGKEVEQLTSQLHTERLNLQTSETKNTTIARQNRELKEKVSSLLIFYTPST